jgi:hypothetical protein
VKSKKCASVYLFAAAALALSVVAFGQGSAPTYQQLTTIAVPGGLAGFDISWLDAASQRFYLADRTATKGTGRIDVIDTRFPPPSPKLASQATFPP